MSDYFDKIIGALMREDEAKEAARACDFASLNVSSMNAMREESIEQQKQRKHDQYMEMVKDLYDYGLRDYKLGRKSFKPVEFLDVWCHEDPFVRDLTDEEKHTAATLAIRALKYRGITKITTKNPPTTYFI